MWVFSSDGKKAEKDDLEWGYNEERLHHVNYKHGSFSPACRMPVSSIIVR